MKKRFWGKVFSIILAGAMLWQPATASAEDLTLEAEEWELLTEEEEVSEYQELPMEEYIEDCSEEVSEEIFEDQSLEQQGDTAEIDISENSSYSSASTSGKTKKVTITAPKTRIIATHDSGNLKTNVSFSASTDNGGDVVFKCSNPKVATIKQKGNKVTVTAVKAGSVKITANAADGSQKSASVTVKVVVPASSIDLSVPKNRVDHELAYGGSLKFKPVIGSKYGKPTKTKVKWSYEIIGYSDQNCTKEKAISDEIMKEIRKNKAFFSFSKGTVKAVSPKKAEKNGRTYWFKTGCNNYAIKVTATATDGTGLSVSKLVKPVRRTTDVYLTGEHLDCIEMPVGYRDLLGYMIMYQNAYTDIYLKVDNPEIAKVDMVEEGPNRYQKLYVYGVKKGTTTMTLKTMDGSNAVCKIKIKVTEQ